VLVGTTAVSVIGGDREVEDRAAVSLWAGRIGAVPTPVRLEAEQTGDGWAIGGLPGPADEPRTLLLVADPFSFPVDAWIAEMATSEPTLSVVGGMASAARGPGGNRLVLDGAVVTSGAVGALLPTRALGGPDTTVVVSQGCRPIGDPMIVTRADGNVIFELAGRPALDRLLELVESAGTEDRERMRQGLHVGIVMDERRATFERGDFLIRNVLGADRAASAIAVGDYVGVGSTVQFQVRDAASADEDLRALLDGITPGGAAGDGALVFTCNGRGVNLFGVPDHDAGVVHAAVHGGGTAGMFCAGEIGPVGGRTFLHGFTASVLLFHE
jgi:small ligand-binding sensory domain FIST